MEISKGLSKNYENRLDSSISKIDIIPMYKVVFMYVSSWLI